MPQLKKSFVYLILLLYFPLLLFCVVGYFYTSQPKYFLKEIVEFFLFSSIVYAIGVIVSKGIFRLYWFLFSTFFLFLVSFLKTAFYYLYQSKLTISAFYIIFETTGTESAGNLSTYYDTFLILL